MILDDDELSAMGRSAVCACKSDSTYPCYWFGTDTDNVTNKRLLGYAPTAYAQTFHSFSDFYIGKIGSGNSLYVPSPQSDASFTSYTDPLYALYQAILLISNMDPSAPENKGYVDTPLSSVDTGAFLQNRGMSDFSPKSITNEMTNNAHRYLFPGAGSSSDVPILIHPYNQFGGKPGPAVVSSRTPKGACYAYWVLAGYQHAYLSPVQSDATHTLQSWGIVQARMAALGALLGPYSAHIGGNTIFADFEGEDPKHNPWKDTIPSDSTVVIRAFLDTLGKYGFTPGVYCKSDTWNANYTDPDYPPGFVFFSSDNTESTFPTCYQIEDFFNLALIKNQKPISGMYPVIWQAGYGDFDVTWQPQPGFSIARAAFTPDTTAPATATPDAT